jgi:AraC-like DNA-binding protein/ActR/RegA family two-component response regulator
VARISKLRPPIDLMIITAAMPGCEDVRFRIVTAAHHFVADAIPFRDGDSRAALDAFLRIAGSTLLPTPELDAVLLRTLALLDRHTGGRLPTMVEHYLSKAYVRSTMLARFQQCVEDVLRYRGIGDPLVQRAIAIFERRYADPTVSAKVVANALGTRPERLAAAFDAQTGMTAAEYLRNLRLDRAAALLLGSDRSVKEVWAAVGYNHASNFDHAFRDRFGQSPRQYRTRGICADQTRPAADRLLQADVAGRADGDARKVLIIDDDRGTRETIGRYLKLQGYCVTGAENGKDGLVAADRTKPAIILLDYRLSDIDGLDWLRLFRSQQAKTPVVMFSADWDLEWKLEELSTLGATFLSKLCDLEDLRDALGEVEMAAHRPHKLQGSPEATE